MHSLESRFANFAAERPSLVWSGVGLFSLASFYLASVRGIVPVWIFSQGEGGLWIDEASRVLSGEVMYRDFFEFIGPVLIHFNALILFLSGDQAIGAILIFILVGMLLVAQTSRLSARLLEGRQLRFLPPLLVVPLYLAYSPGNHKWITWLAILTAVDLLARPRRAHNRAWFAGALLGLSVLSTSDIGMAASVGVLFALWRSKPSELVACILGTFLTITSILALFSAIAGLGTLLESLILFPLSGYRAPSAGPAFSATGAIPVHFLYIPRLLFLWSIALSGTVAAFTVASRRPRTGGFGVGALSLAGLGSVLAIALNRAMEPTQLASGSLLLLIPLVWTLHASRTRSGAIILVVLVVTGSYTALTTVASRQLRPATLIQTPSGQIWDPGAMPLLPNLLASTDPGDATFLFPDKGGFYFLSKTRNVTSFPYLQDMGFSLPHQVNQAIDQIEVTKPAIGIFDTSRLYSRGDPHNDSLRPLTEYLELHYESIAPGVLRRRGARDHDPQVRAGPVQRDPG